MREFLYSEISQIENIPNIPDNPELTIAAGKQLCEQILEPIQTALGRISIRSGYRSATLNAIGAEKQYNCAPNASNYALHIWDVKDSEGYIGATACIIIPSFLPYYQATQDWTALAWWIHDHIPAYSSMTFFPINAAFNISWRENPNLPKRISSKIENPHTGQTGILTETGMDNFSGSHEAFYRDYLQQLRNE